MSRLENALCARQANEIKLFRALWKQEYSRRLKQPKTSRDPVGRHWARFENFREIVYSGVDRANPNYFKTSFFVVPVAPYIYISYIGYKIRNRINEVT